MNCLANYPIVNAMPDLKVMSEFNPKLVETFHRIAEEIAKQHGYNGEQDLLQSLNLCSSYDSTEYKCAKEISEVFSAEANKPYEKVELKNFITRNKRSMRFCIGAALGGCGCTGDCNLEEGLLDVFCPKCGRNFYVKDMDIICECGNSEVKQ